ncbi:MAG TPA: dTMP kinase [Candidatus Eremiobacteraceae bacterium]|nr:dTMP kinase [Candidatus Eremiobacteraceae bacterium]
MAGGLFVTFEGVEGAGKSTQVRLLADNLSRAGMQSVVTREPGGTPLGERVRALLIDPGADMSRETEALLLNSSRAELVDKTIAPALRAGKLVVCDRFWDATLAYQGYGRGLPLDNLQQLNLFAARGLTPDLTFLLDIPLDISRQRLQGRSTDRMERENQAFHERVARGYRELAAANAQRFVVLDGTQPQAQVAAQVLDAVLKRWHA